MTMTLEDIEKLVDQEFQRLRRGILSGAEFKVRVNKIIDLIPDDLKLERT